MEGRHAHRLYGGQVLGRASEGSRSSAGSSERLRGGQIDPGGGRVQQRSYRHVEGSSSRSQDGGGSMFPGLCRDFKGWAPSWKEGEARQGSPDRRLDGKPERIERGRRRRRDGQVEEAGGRRYSSSRGGQTRKERKFEGEGQEKEKERQLQRLREQKEEKEKEKEKAQGEDRGNQKLGSSVWKHRVGPKPNGEEAGQEEGAEAWREEVKALQQRELVKQQRRFWERGLREQRWPAVRRGGEDQAHLESFSRSPDLGDFGEHAGGRGESFRAAMGHLHWPPPSNLHPVLEAHDVWPSVRAPGQGDTNIVFSPRPFASRQNLLGGGCRDPAVEVVGTAGSRGPLHDQSEARTGPSGDWGHVVSSGGPGGEQSSKGGVEGKGSFSSTLGKQVFLGKERARRKRESEGQRRKGQDKEGRSGSPLRWGKRRPKEAMSRRGREACTSEKKASQFPWARESQDSEGLPVVDEARLELAGSGLEKEDTKSFGELANSGTMKRDVSQRTTMQQLGTAALDFAGYGPSQSDGDLLHDFPMEETGAAQFLAPVSDYDFPVAGKSFADLALHFQKSLTGLLNDYDMPQGRTQCSGGTFPLPETYEVILEVLGIKDGSQARLLQMMCQSLNSYYNARPNDQKPPTKATRLALQAMSAYAADLCGWQEKFVGASWDEYMSVKSIDYRGEEVKVARYFSWQNIEPSLPEGIGSIPLESVCELGTLDYVSRFKDFLIPAEDRVISKVPRVMVHDDAWEQVCSGLLEKGVCDLIHYSDVYQIDGKLLQSGMFGVTKSEFSDGVEVYRLIMNLVPVNKLCRNLGSDLSTLPSWAGMSPYLLGEDEVIVMSSEDIRCFFYLFSIPNDWKSFMSFGKEVPRNLWPEGCSGPFFLTSRVLPMGFLNSVSIAQHVHRRISRLALHSPVGSLGAQHELRKDKPFTVASPLYRVYLDNFDLLEKTDKHLADEIQGQVSGHILALREAYQFWGLPRHPKKSVQQLTQAEIQGAIVDGRTGLVKPKPDKVLRYIELALLLLKTGEANQRQLQIVCGGFVYFCMFRRALLGALNAVWQFIVSFEGEPPVIRKKLPDKVRVELGRFIGLAPFAQMNLRARLEGSVTASDASEYGGGFCISNGLTAMGCHAACSSIRGDLPEPEDHVQVLCIGLFDGIGALRVACDCLRLPMGGYVSAEINKEGQRVVESHFPDSQQVGNVQDITEDMVKGWALQYSNVGVVVVAGGPPCQGVSGLNSDRKGALRDARSNLFVHVPRVYKLCRKHFRWAQVHHLMESVFSMDEKDRVAMSMQIGSTPWLVDSCGISLCRRPRLYWFTWEPREGTGVTIVQQPSTEWDSYGIIQLDHPVNPPDFLLTGWELVDQPPLPTFTTSRPRTHPGNRPAGLWQCTKAEVERWKDDM